MICEVCGKEIKGLAFLEEKENTYCHIECIEGVIKDEKEIIKSDSKSEMSMLSIAKRSGVSRDFIYKYLRGDIKTIKDDKITRLCKTLGISADWLLGLRE